MDYIPESRVLLAKMKYLFSEDRPEVEQSVSREEQSSNALNLGTRDGAYPYHLDVVIGLFSHCGPQLASVHTTSFNQM